MVCEGDRLQEAARYNPLGARHFLLVMWHVQAKVTVFGTLALDLKVTVYGRAGMTPGLACVCAHLRQVVGVSLGGLKGDRLQEGVSCI